RSKRDWSSDVCSSDLTRVAHAINEVAGDTDVTIMASFTSVLEKNFRPTSVISNGQLRQGPVDEGDDAERVKPKQFGLPIYASARSEERRVGKAGTWTR